MPFFFTYAKVKDMSEPEYKPYSVVCNGNQLFTQELKETANYLVTKDGIRYTKENHLSEYLASRTEKVGTHKNFYRVYPEHHKVVTQLKDREKKRYFKTQVIGKMNKSLSELSLDKARFLNTALNLGVELPVFNSEQPMPTYSSVLSPWEYKQFQHAALESLYSRGELKVGATIHKGTKISKNLTQYVPKSSLILDAFMSNINEAYSKPIQPENLGLGSSLKDKDYEELENLVNAWFGKHIHSRVKTVVEVETILVTQEMIDHFEKVSRGRE